MKILKKVVKSVPSNVVSFPKKAISVEDIKPMSYRQMMAREFLHSAKKGTVPVSDLLDFAQEQDKKCFDEVVDFSEVTTSFEELMGKQEVHLNRQGNEGFFTPYSSSQLFSRFGIPNAYAKYCMNNGGNDLLIENLEHWREKFGGKYLLRYYDMEGSKEPMIRAVLTEKYKAFDTFDIMKVVNSNTDIHKNYSVRNWLINPERLHVRLVSDERLNVESDEDLFMGVNLDSSDVGRSSLRLSIIVFKQVCTNGLVLPQSISKVYRQIHFGAGADRFEENVIVALNAVSQIKEIAEEVITKAGSKKLPFDIEDEEQVEHFRVSHKVSKDAMSLILQGMKEEKYGKPSVWSLINVMTEVAQDYTLDTRIDIEREAGRLLLVS